MRGALPGQATAGERCAYRTSTLQVTSSARRLSRRTGLKAGPRAGLSFACVVQGVGKTANSLSLD